MCLAVPGRVIDLSTEDGLRYGKVDFGGLARRVCLEHVPDIRIGEYVLVHVGFALARVDEEEARALLALLSADDLEALEEDA